MSDASGSKENPTGTVAPRKEAGIAGQVQAVLDGMSLALSGKTAELSALVWKADAERAQAVLDARHWHAEFQRALQERDAAREALWQACNLLENDDHSPSVRAKGVELRARALQAPVAPGAATQPTPSTTPEVPSHG